MSRGYIQILEEYFPNALRAPILAADALGFDKH
jgi:hypothetical protein